MQIFLLFWTFFKIGLFTIGGGYAMIPLIQQEVERYSWIASDDLINFIAISESTPGPFAINIATFVGMNSYGIWGAVLATCGVVLPSFIIILVIAKYFHKFSDNIYVKASLSGLRPVVIGLMLSTAFTIAISNFFSNLSINISQISVNVKGIIIFVIVLLLSKLLKLHPILIIIISAGLGIVFYGFF
ncbi:MAG: chromate transporter [Oscillospiraceae bacterium]